MNIASSGSGARRGPQFKGVASNCFPYLRLQKVMISIELLSVSMTAKSNAMLSPLD